MWCMSKMCYGFLIALGVALKTPDQQKCYLRVRGDLDVEAEDEC